MSTTEFVREKMKLEKTNALSPKRNSRFELHSSNDQNFNMFRIRHGRQALSIPLSVVSVTSSWIIVRRLEGTPWNCLWSSRTIRESISKTITFLPTSKSFLVTLPLPRPISSTTSVVLIPDFWIMESTSSGFLSICWPLDLWKEIPP